MLSELVAIKNGGVTDLPPRALDGLLCLDTAHNNLYVRMNGTWVSVALASKPKAMIGVCLWCRYPIVSESRICGHCGGHA